MPNARSVSKKPTPITATKTLPPDIEEFRAQAEEAGVEVEEAAKRSVAASRKLKEAKAAQEASAKYQLVRMVDGGDHDPENSYMLSKPQFEMLAAFLKIMRQNHGCSTPVDEFICGLWRHAVYAMTPENVQEDLDQCKENFESAIGEAKQLVRQYQAHFALTPEVE